MIPERSSDKHPHTRTSRFLIPVVLCLIFGAVGSAVINETSYYNPDSAHYLDWARSLAQGDGFRLLSHPEPRRYVTNAPLYPVLLAPVAVFLPGSIPAAKTLTLMFGMMVIVVMYRIILRYTYTIVAAVSGVFLVLNPLMIVYATQVLSDVPFASGMLCWFWLAQRMESGDVRKWVFPLFVIVTTACMLLRDVGIVLLVGGVVWLVARKDVQRAMALIGTCLAVYLLWALRNEVVVGSAEHVVNRNTSFFFSHFLTPDNTGIGAEILARWKSNGSLYGILAGCLLFIPQSVGTLYDVVRPDALLLTPIRHIASTLYLPIAAITLVVPAWGGVLFLKRPGPARILAVIPVLYLIILLCYPISDIRFLFPTFLLEMFLFAYAVKAFLNLLATFTVWRRIALSSAAVCFVLIAAIPNALWTANFVQTSLHYRGLSGGLPSATEQSGDYPGEFVKPFGVVMEWIDSHTDSTAVIASDYAEAGLRARGRTVIDVSPLQSAEAFEANIRDYQVPYLISVNDQYGPNEYAFILPAVRHYRFVPEFRSGDIEVLRITPDAAGSSARGKSEKLFADTTQGISTAPQNRGDVRQVFISAIELLYADRATEASGIFGRLRRYEHIAMPATYYAGVAAELAGRFDDARALFEGLRKFPQSASYVKQARYHLEIIDRLQGAAKSNNTDEKLSAYQSASLAYWDLGFRPRALDILHTAMRISPNFFPSYVFGTVFELQLGDTAAAQTYATRAESLNPRQDISRSLKTVFLQLDSLRMTRSPEGAPERRRTIARQYISLGLNNMAIDELLDIVRTNPSDAMALRLLADVYIARDCYLPAVRTLRKLVAIDPGNVWGKNELLRLVEMWK